MQVGSYHITQLSGLAIFAVTWRMKEGLHPMLFRDIMRLANADHTLVATSSIKITI